MKAPGNQFSFGIEEEYHLVDRSTRDLAVAPPGFLEDLPAPPRRLGGQGPEFLATPRSRSARPVCTSSQVGSRRRSARLRSVVAEVAGPATGWRPIAAPAPIRLPIPPGFADHRQGAIPGAGRGPGRHRPAHGDQRHARARRHRRSRPAHRPDEPGTLFHAASAGAVHLLTVLAGRGYRPQELSPRHRRRELPRTGLPGRTRELG